MMGATEAGIGKALAIVAERLGVVPVATGTTIAWSRGEVTFATLADDVAEFRLDGPIAAAARRTPDTALSERGEGWVRFAPREADRMALDRAEAWFEAAFRRAG